MALPRPPRHRSLTSAVRRRYPVASTALLALSRGVHQRLELALKWTELRGGDIPHNSVIHAKIVVNKAIAHAGHLSPLNVRLLRAQFLRSRQGGILAERDEVQTLQLGQDVLDLIKHVPDELTRRFGHAPPPAGYGGRCGGSGSQASLTRPDAPGGPRGRRRGP